MLMNLDPDVLCEILSYDPLTGIFTWNQRDASFFKTPTACLIWNAKFPGTRAGTTRTDSRFGYKSRVIKIFGRAVYEHRVAWVMMTKEQPPEEIDHINRDATDNRWENLRASDHSANHRNRSRNSTNISGRGGVSWDKVSQKWRAYPCLNYKRYSLGRYESLHDAIKAVDAFYASHGFDKEHGKIDTPY